MAREFESFADFYPYYLEEHSNPRCRGLHYTGSLLIVALTVYILAFRAWPLLWLVPVIGYGFAWIGHFFFERNRPATFKYPVYSLIGDWVMLKDFLTGQLPDRHPSLKKKQ